MDCIHDGDTWWLAREKFRHASIDAPEIGDDRKCGRERVVGLRARDRLVDLTAAGFTIERTGKLDRYGRTLAFIRLKDGREAGAVLVAEGLAERYGTRPPTDWCTR